MSYAPDSREFFTDVPRDHPSETEPPGLIRGYLIDNVVNARKPLWLHVFGQGRYCTPPLIPVPLATQPNRS